VLSGVVSEKEKFDFSVCNPPFFSDFSERKFRFSSVCPIAETEELTEGGEAGFIARYI